MPEDQLRIDAAELADADQNLAITLLAFAEEGRPSGWPAPTTATSQDRALCGA